jgi:hypothetical protein
MYVDTTTGLIEINCVHTPRQESAKHTFFVFILLLHLGQKPYQRKIHWHFLNRTLELSLRKMALMNKDSTSVSPFRHEQLCPDDHAC